MSELSHLIKAFQGNYTNAQVLAGAGVSRETYRKLQCGTSVKLSTLRDISRFLKLDESKWRQLVIAWIRLEIGPDAKHIHIEPSPHPIRERDDQSREICTLAAQLSLQDQKHVLKAITRPEVLRVLPSLNHLHEQITSLKTERKD